LTFGAHFCYSAPIRTPLPIVETLQVVAGAWQTAEERLRARVSTIYKGAGEEFITELMHGSFTEELGELNSLGAVERAFSSDLQKACPNVSVDCLRSIAKGLIAQTSLHPRDIERSTGGDLGFVISRPRVTRSGDRLNTERQYRRGLLCQAKLKKSARPWGHFTDRQQEVLPGRVAYLAIVLYRYLDAEQQTLDAFRWQECAGSEFKDVIAWLARDVFPSPSDSRRIITRLGEGKIGTDDTSTIDTIIAPKRGRVLTVTIDWPPGQGPRPSVDLQVMHRIQSRETIRIRA
jgi:hypothetical protein